MGKNICKRCDLQGINLQNLQTVHAAKYQKNKLPNKKTGKNLIDISSKKTYRWPRGT